MQTDPRAHNRQCVPGFYGLVYGCLKSPRNKADATCFTGPDAINADHFLLAQTPAQIANSKEY